jgi:hypothetical protein
VPPTRVDVQEYILLYDDAMDQWRHPKTGRVVAGALMRVGRDVCHLWLRGVTDIRPEKVLGVPEGSFGL